METINQSRVLICIHCKSDFVPTKSQWNHRHGRPKTYCSDICRIAVNQLKKKKAIPERGPCKNCEQMFFSKREKKYCSLFCYNSSDDFLEMLRINSKKGCEISSRNAGNNLAGRMQPCLECGKEFYCKPNQIGKKKYCSVSHYRLYLAKRFDRWVASPKEISLMNNYDEFLSQNELDCLICRNTLNSRKRGVKNNA